jgi:hypothetical protein
MFKTYMQLKKWECAEAYTADEATLFARYRSAY